MKLLYFGDKHNRINTPENRLDDFQETMKAKDLEIIELGKKHGVSAFLQPGDFWDSPNPPLDYASGIIKRWFNVDVFEILHELMINKALTNESLEKLKGFVPMVGVAGNHELFGNNINTLPKTMIGFMEKLGLIRFATKENPYYLQTEDGLTVAITGTHYHLDIDNPANMDDYIVEQKLGDYHIHIVHGMLSDKSMGKMIRHTIVDQIKHTKADLTITGHDHIGFPITQIDGKYFVNTGAITRLTNDVKEIKRTPKVLLIDISKESGLQLKEVNLQTAIDGNIVLNRKKIESKKEKESKIEGFKKAVRDAQIVKTTDINEIIRDITENQKLPLSIRDDVVNRVSEKIKSMDSGLEGIFPEAYIDELIIENFQSHEYSEIKLSRGFNILIGESRQGKSSTLRTLYWIFQNRPLGKSMIRKGAEYAKATIRVSNGYIISRYIEAKAGGKNGYYITDPATGETAFHNTKILPEIQKILGFNVFSIDDKDLQFNLNFLKQGAGWFLIGDQFSSPTKAKVIGAIYGTQYADAVTRELELEERRLADKAKNTIDEYKKKDFEIKQYEHLPELKRTIDTIDCLIKETKELEDKRNNIESILNQRELLVTNIEDSTRDLEELKNLNDARSKLLEVQRELNRKDRISDALDKFDEYSKYLKNSSFVVTLMKEIGAWKKIFEETKTLFSRRVELDSCIEKRNVLLSDIATQNIIIEETKNIDVAKSLFEATKQDLACKNNLLEKIALAENIEKKKHELETGVEGCNKILNYTRYNNQAKEVVGATKDLIDKKAKIEHIFTDRDVLMTEIEAMRANIQLYTNKLTEDVKKYQTVLEVAGKCPVCFGTIDKATVNRIVDNYLPDKK